jgi:N-acyl-D-amino-acid deacylase
LPRRPTAPRGDVAIAAWGHAGQAIGETADFFGFKDRGRLAPGLRADVNLIDFDGLRLHQPEVVHDLPAGGRRLVQRVDGYRATLVAGIPVFEDGEETGARPGRLVRAGR